MIKLSYISLPQRLDESTSVTIEAEAGQDGFLADHISDEELRVALNKTVKADIRRACWRDALCAKELGLYTARVLQDDKDITLKVWIVPWDGDFVV